MRFIERLQEKSHKYVIATFSWSELFNPTLFSEARLLFLSVFGGFNVQNFHLLHRFTDAETPTDATANEQFDWQLMMEDVNKSRQTSRNKLSIVRYKIHYNAMLRLIRVIIEPNITTISFN